MTACAACFILARGLLGPFPSKTLAAVKMTPDT